MSRLMDEHSNISHNVMVYLRTGFRMPAPSGSCSSYWSFFCRLSSRSECLLRSDLSLIPKGGLQFAHGLEPGRLEGLLGYVRT
jgi:hypothetical protein